MKQQQFFEILFLVLSVICVIYGLQVQSIGSGTKFYLIWFVLAGVFLLLVYSSRRNLWGRAPKSLKIVLTSTLVSLLLLFTIVEALILSAFSWKGNEGLDYIIVLGAQVYEDGVSKVLQYRLDKAVEYLEENPHSKCIVTGGKGSNEPYEEAIGMQKYLLEKGISSERILLEKKALSTEENIKYSKELIEEGSTVGIVTNNFHVYRAIQIAKKNGLKDAQGISASSTEVFLVHNMLREFFSMMKLWITRGI